MTDRFTPVQDERAGQPGGVTRRDLARGVVAGGALFWTAPAVQFLGATPARADDPSGGPAVPPAPSQPQATCAPSHGLVVVASGGASYRFQVTRSGSLDRVGSPSDRRFLASEGHGPAGDAPAWIRSLVSATATESMLTVSVIPGSDCRIVAAYVADGNPEQRRGGGQRGLDYLAASFTAMSASFSTPRKGDDRC